MSGVWDQLSLNDCAIRIVGQKNSHASACHLLCYFSALCNIFETIYMEIVGESPYIVEWNWNLSDFLCIILNIQWTLHNGNLSKKMLGDCFWLAHRSLFLETSSHSLLVPGSWPCRPILLRVVPGLAEALKLVPEPVQRLLGWNWQICLPKSFSGLWRTQNNACNIEFHI